jgi:predicted AAA+ superfamily ATPase
MIERAIKDRVIEELEGGKAAVIYGPRQVGKTTLAESIFGSKDNVLWINGDDDEAAELMDFTSAKAFAKKIEYKYDSIVIDEAQRIGDIGIKLKRLHDYYKKKTKILATGSSSFDSANKINEPLTVRKREFHLFPLLFSEMAKVNGVEEEAENLERRMLYGYYPEVVTTEGSEEEILYELTSASLYKDVLKWGNIQKSDKLTTLLQAISYQVGNLVSVNELAGVAGIDFKTAEKYLNLLEQSFIIYHLGSFSRNLRNELKTSKKYYFYDVGIRNAVINDFSPVDKRNDKGALFENFVISEFIKKDPKILFGNSGYFWRDTDGKEVDFVRLSNGKVFAYEIKWKKQARLPKKFIEGYLPHKAGTITKDNFFDEIM